MTCDSGKGREDCEEEEEGGKAVTCDTVTLTVVTAAGAGCQVTPAAGPAQSMTGMRSLHLKKHHGAI